MRRRAFRRILTRDAGPNAGASAVAAAARRACERLTYSLTPLIGPGGVTAICARSLHLASEKFAGLSQVHASDQPDEPFARLHRFLAQQEPAAATEAAVDVLATAGDLLALFIGESLTIRVLSQAWPGDFAGDATEVTTR